MPDTYPGEDARLIEIERRCGHEHGVMVCIDCGQPLPAPVPHGYDIFDGEWSDPAYD